MTKVKFSILLSRACGFRNVSIQLEGLRDRMEGKDPVTANAIACLDRTGAEISKKVKGVAASLDDCRKRYAPFGVRREWYPVFSGAVGGLANRLWQVCRVDKYTLLRTKILEIREDLLKLKAETSKWSGEGLAVISRDLQNHAGALWNACVLLDNYVIQMRRYAEVLNSRGQYVLRKLECVGRSLNQEAKKAEDEKIGGPFHKRLLRVVGAIVSGAFTSVLAFVVSHEAALTVLKSITYFVLGAWLQRCVASMVRKTCASVEQEISNGSCRQGS